MRVSEKSNMCALYIGDDGLCLDYGCFGEGVSF